MNDSSHELQAGARKPIDALARAGETLPSGIAGMKRVLSALSITGGLLALLALADLAVRAAVRLEVRWDTFAYHLPFAALRAGLAIPYELNDKIQPTFAAYPPLADVVQGVLWRLTGSMNATGVVNYLAFVGFLAYCWRLFGAPFWLVTLISLTAPMVVIHTCVSYIDLFGNAFLAAGACSCLYLFLFPDQAPRGVLLGGLVALAAACWTKYLLVPVAALMFCIFAVLALSRPRSAGFSRRTAALLCASAVLIGALPYLRNWSVYGNPFWPLRLPFVGDSFPYLNDALQGRSVEQPAHTRQMSQFVKFLHSIFEIHHPTRYAARPRWLIDQGNASIAFRMGGFWNVAVAVYLVSVVVLLWVCQRRRGLIASAGILGVLGFVALLPQSHELRYYMFIPLSGAATIGMLFPQLASQAPRLAAALLALSIGLFSYMVSENWTHYRIERIDQAAAAQAWGADLWWPRLARGRTYCAVDMVPMAMLLTGPTLSEYRIVDRSRRALCPPGSIPISH